MKSPSTVEIFPAKHFFVEMLTRDISLADAILDLLDNCVDGVRRSISHHGSKPYEGYFAEIEFDEKHFQISDNCGGISKQDAEGYALMLGRPREVVPRKDGTIGLVGIGMKRAMFKIGTNCFIHSYHEGDTFSVKIEPQWLTDDDNWKLILNPAEPLLEDYGTLIKVTHLRDSVKDDFAKQSLFREDELPRKVREAFGLLIERGFQVIVNDISIEPEIPHLLWEPKQGHKSEIIRPYVYKDTIDGVDVFIAFGFREPDRDSSDERSTLRYSSSQAGWTVACNDRIVLSFDKSETTGWGSMGAPQYHTQFTYLSGVVEFHCKDTSKLPFNTTKRGINGGSHVFLKARDRMIEALKMFTSWTNEWKDRPTSDREMLFKKAQSLPLPEIRTVAAKEYKNIKVKLGNPIKPKLPKAKTSSDVNIQFRKSQSEINIVSEFLFEESRPARTVGEACFDRVLGEANM